jgi:DNA-binding transcriptional LysR family regulator
MHTAWLDWSSNKMTKNALSWEDAQTLLAVIECQSFSRAATSLGVGQPTVSRRIQALEARLKQQLFIRGKHGAQATAAANDLQVAARQMAKWAAEFQRIANGSEDKLSGVIKIAAPPGVAVEQIAPFAATLRKLEPELRLEVLAAVDHVDLTRGAADIAVRTNYPNEPQLECLYEAEIQPKVYGAKSYVATLNQPCKWEDLDWISWAGQYSSLSPRSILEKAIPDFKPSFASDDFLVQKAAAVAGLGAMIMSESESLQESGLVEIDIGVRLPTVNFYLVCAKSMSGMRKIQKVSHLLIEHFVNAS